MATLTKLKDLAARAGQWLGLSAPATPARHTAAVTTDRFDEMTWTEIAAQAAALRDLIEDLGGRHDYAGDLVRDIFLAAYKAAPQLRDPAEMDPSRLVNRQIVTSVLGTPEFTELRRETVGDEYASAMAVLAQAEHLRQMTEEAREAQQAAGADADAQQAAAQAQAGLQEAMDQAEAQAAPDGTVPAGAAQAAEQAMAAAGQAGQAAQQAADAASQERDAIGAALRAAARQGADTAAEQARDEADLMAAWGVSPGELRRMPFGQRRQLAQRLRGGRLGRFARLIGRFRRMAAGERARKVEHAPGELIGIEVSGDLSRLIPSEMATLGVPAMRAVFAARLAESRLFTYATIGEDRVGLGPVIAAIDSSGSMETGHEGGITREAWSKALALALLDQARAGRRDFVAILFGSGDELKVFRFPAGRAPAISDVIDFAEFFFGGGTDFEVPLTAAAGIMEEAYNGAGQQRADVVFVTDGQCRVGEEWLRGWRECKARLGFRVFGVTLAREPGPVMGALCDNVRGVYDLADPGVVRDIFRVT